MAKTKRTLDNPPIVEGDELPLYDVVIERKTVRRMIVGVRAKDAKEAQVKVLNMPKVHREAGWLVLAGEKPKAVSASKRAGEMHPLTRRWIDP